MITEFLKEIDNLWPTKNDGKITLNILGSSALMLQCDRYRRKSKDTDIFEIDEITADIVRGGDHTGAGDVVRSGHMQKT